MSNNKHAKLHAILPRKGDKAVVFRRGPSSCVAVIGGDLAKDTFTIGQWLRGRIYPFRCDLSPSGEYLLYFAAKYGKVNPVEKFVNDKVIERIGEPFYGSIRSYEKYFQQREREEELIRKEFAKEIQKIRNGRDYTNRSWTAISRAPYLKAIDLWFNGSGWNGGGKFIDEKTVWINTPLMFRGEHLHHIQSRKFKELAEPPIPEWETENNGECPGIYPFRLLRDNWQYINIPGEQYIFEKILPQGLILRKEFGYGKNTAYAETHTVLDAERNTLIDGKSWEWADFDARHKRIVYAENGAIYAIYLRRADLKERLLYDFNDMKFEALTAPY
jgi:hypothetical protein